MPANLELQVLSKIIETRDFHTVQRLRVGEDLFVQPETKEVFRYLWNHFHSNTTQGSVPSFEVVKDLFPRLPYIPSPDDLATLCDSLRMRVLRDQLVQVASEIAQLADVDPRQAIERLREQTAQLASRHDITDDLEIAQAADQIKRDYDLVASGQGLTGLPWPWAELNKDTQGMHPGDFIVIYGRPKNMKSFVALWIACWTFQQAGARVLIYSMEMKPIRVLRRCAAMLARVDYKKFIEGQLNQMDYQQVFGWFELLRATREAAPTSSTPPAALLVSGRARGDHSAGGVATLQSKIREFRPTLVVIDGLYLMRDDRSKVRTIDWKSVAHISQDVKGTADAFGIPIIGVTQQKRGTKDNDEVDTEDIAYADAVGQDADLIINVKKKKLGPSDVEVILRFPGTRESDLDGFVIYGQPGVTMDFKSNIIPATTASQSSSPTFGKSSGNHTPAQAQAPVLPSFRKQP